MQDDVLRARVIDRLRAHFPEVGPTALGLVAIDLRDVILEYAHDRVAADRVRASVIERVAGVE